MKVYSDSRSAIALSVNHIQNKRTEHVRNDCHFIRDSNTAEKITSYYVPSLHQFVYILTKALGRKELHMFVSKLGIYDVHAQFEERCCDICYICCNYCISAF